MSGSAIPASFNTRHNHQKCIRDALNNARVICAKNEVRFTALRERVLELIWSSHRPVVAYDILKKLRLEKDNAEPPTIYRTLEFLLDNDLIHRIESLNAYVGCVHPAHKHISQFLICNDCRSVTELEDPDIEQTIVNSATQKDFKVRHHVIEISGICSACQL